MAVTAKERRKFGRWVIHFCTLWPAQAVAHKLNQAQSQFDAGKTQQALASLVAALDSGRRARARLNRYLDDKESEFAGETRSQFVTDCVSRILPVNAAQCDTALTAIETYLQGLYDQSPNGDSTLTWLQVANELASQVEPWTDDAETALPAGYVDLSGA